MNWLKKGFNGSMGYLVRNTDKRFAPDKLELGTCRVISARMNYLYEGIQPIKVLENPASGYIARYALGRDYHKVLRTRLAKLAKKMDNAINSIDVSGSKLLMTVGNAVTDTDNVHFSSTIDPYIPGFGINSFWHSHSESSWSNRSGWCNGHGRV